MIYQPDKIIEDLGGLNSCGVDLREQEGEASLKYLSLKDLRSSLRRNERKNVEVDHNLLIDSNDWQEVVRTAADLLSNHSKDIEVASWFLEGIVRIEGFAGLRVGLDIVAALFEEYGSDLYPKVEEDDIELKLASIAMLSGKYEMGTLIAPIYFFDLLKTRSDEHYNAWEIKKLLKKKGNESHEIVTQDLILGSEELKQAVFSLDLENFSAVETNLEASTVSLKRFNNALTQVFQSQAPSLANLTKTLTYVLSIVASTRKIIGAKEEKAIEQLGIQEVVKSPSSLSLTDIDYSKLNKETALRVLESLVKFFRETEPHSPVSYALDRSLRWSKMPLGEVLSEILPDDAREHYCSISGVPFSER